MGHLSFMPSWVRKKGPWKCLNNSIKREYIFLNIIIQYLTPFDQNLVSSRLSENISKVTVWRRSDIDC